MSRCSGMPMLRRVAVLPDALAGSMPSSLAKPSGGWSISASAAASGALIRAATSSWVVSRPLMPMPVITMLPSSTTTSPTCPPATWKSMRRPVKVALPDTPVSGGIVSK